MLYQNVTILKNIQITHHYQNPKFIIGIFLFKFYRLNVKIKNSLMFIYMNKEIKDIFLPWKRQQILVQNKLDFLHFISLLK